MRAAFISTLALAATRVLAEDKPAGDDNGGDGIFTSDEEDGTLSFSSFQDAAGQISEAWGYVKFVYDLIPKAKDIPGTVVTLHVNNGKDDWDYEGTIKAGFTFGTDNELLGSSDVDPIDRTDAGGFSSFTVHQPMGHNEDAQYLSLIASDDEICISYLSAGLPGNDKPFYWAGDVGRACGQAWEWGMSNSAGAGDSAAYSPACMWLDTDDGKDIDGFNPKAKPNGEGKTDHINTKQIKIDLMAYAGANIRINKDQDIQNKTYNCGSTIFSDDSARPIMQRTPGGFLVDGVKRKRDMSAAASAAHSSTHSATRAQPTKYPTNGTASVTATTLIPSSTQKATDPNPNRRPRSERSASTLRVSDNKFQSARVLCNSLTSSGSDFVSPDEGLVCHMDTHTIAKLCKEDGTDEPGCFHFEPEQKRLRKRSAAFGEQSIYKRNDDIKQYKRVEFHKGMNRANIK